MANVNGIDKALTNNKQTEKIRRIPIPITIGLWVLFVFFLVALTIIAIRQPDWAGVLIAVFVFVSLSITVVYFAIIINNRLILKETENIRATWDSEKEFLSRISNDLDHELQKLVEDNAND